jgi:hypothetical protein
LVVSLELHRANAALAVTDYAILMEDAANFAGVRKVVCVVSLCRGLNAESPKTCHT